MVLYVIHRSIDYLYCTVYVCYVCMCVYLDIRCGLSISRFKGGGEATAPIRPHTCHANVA